MKYKSVKMSLILSINNAKKNKYCANKLRALKQDATCKWKKKIVYKRMFIVVVKPCSINRLLAKFLKSSKKKRMIENIDS